MFFFFYKKREKAKGEARKTNCSLEHISQEPNVASDFVTLSICFIKNCYGISLSENNIKLHNNDTKP